LDNFLIFIKFYLMC